MTMPPPPQGGIDLSVLARPPVFPLKLDLNYTNGKAEVMIYADGSIGGDMPGLDKYLAEVRQGVIPLEILLHLQRIAWQGRVQDLLLQMAELLAQAKEEGVSVAPGF